MSRHLSKIEKENRKEGDVPSQNLTFIDVMQVVHNYVVWPAKDVCSLSLVCKKVIPPGVACVHTNTEDGRIGGPTGRPDMRGYFFCLNDLPDKYRFVNIWALQDCAAVLPKLQPSRDCLKSLRIFDWDPIQGPTEIENFNEFVSSLTALEELVVNCKCDDDRKVQLTPPESVKVLHVHYGPWDGSERLGNSLLISDLKLHLPKDIETVQLCGCQIHSFPLSTSQSCARFESLKVLYLRLVTAHLDDYLILPPSVESVRFYRSELNVKSLQVPRTICNIRLQCMKGPDTIIFEHEPEKLSDITFEEVGFVSFSYLFNGWRLPDYNLPAEATMFSWCPDSKWLRFDNFVSF